MMLCDSTTQQNSNKTESHLLLLLAAHPCLLDRPDRSNPAEHDIFRTRGQVCLVLKWFLCFIEKKEDTENAVTYIHTREARQSRAPCGPRFTCFTLRALQSEENALPSTILCLHVIYCIKQTNLKKSFAWEGSNMSSWTGLKHGLCWPALPHYFFKI